MEALRSMTEAEPTIGSFAEISHLVTESEIIAFAQLSGDNNPIHISLDQAQEHGHDGLVSHGVLTNALISRIIGTRLPGPGSLWINQSTEYVGVVHPGDRLTGRVEVVKVFARDRIVDVVATVVNQHSEVVLRGRGRVRLPAKALEVTQDQSDLNLTYSILILGGSSSIGLALTEHLARAGYGVISTFNRNPDRLESVVAACRKLGAQVRTIQFDTDSADELGKKIDELSRLDVKPIGLINCIAADPRMERAISIDPETFVSRLTSESLSLLTGVRTLYQEMLNRGFGRIINIGSSARYGPADMGWLTYIASKQVGFSVIRSLAIELGQFGITANSIAPGFLGTGMTRNVSERYLSAVLSQTPTGKLTSTESICSAAQYLLSAAASDVNGQELVIDGGRT